MLSFKPGDKITLTPWAGAEYINQIFPCGKYRFQVYAGKGGTGTGGIPGGKGGYGTAVVSCYEEKKFTFYIGMAGALYECGKVISPGAANNIPSWKTSGSGGYGGYDNPVAGALEYGGGGGGKSEVTIWHKGSGNYDNGFRLMAVGGGGGGAGWNIWESGMYGGVGGISESAPEGISPTYRPSSYSNENGQDGLHDYGAVSEGCGGGGGGSVGGATQPYYQLSNGRITGGGGFGGRSKIVDNYYNYRNTYVTSTSLSSGICDGHGYIIVTFIDYIWYSIYWTNCIYSTSVGEEGNRITGRANITYNEYNPDGKLYRCNENLGFFSHITYSYVSNVSFNTEKTEITFTMQRNNAYINAVFINYKIICTRCISINNGDKVLIPGRKYRVKAEPTSERNPFIDFSVSGIDKNSVRWISRLEFEFVMPENHVYVTALYLDDTRYNTDIYKQVRLNDYFDWNKL